MFLHYVLHEPYATGALKAGGAHDCGIRIHIDSGASRHFTSDIRLLASWDEDVPNITLNTISSVPITSKAIGTVFLASDVSGNTRVVTLEHTYYVPNQTHNRLSASQPTKQRTYHWESPHLADCT